MGSGEVTITISNLTTLENDLLSNGMDSRAVEIIYSAASCNLKRHKEIDDKLTKLAGPIEQLHVSVNKALNELIKKSDNLRESEGTLELMVRHTLDTNQSSNRGLAVEESNVDIDGYQGVGTSNEIEYLPMSYKTELVDPELCKTYNVVKELVIESRERKHGIVKIAHRVYKFEGPNTVSGLAKFYSDYVRINYNERIKVMGLAKLLGEFASIVSEVYFMEDALRLHEDKCGIKPADHVRRKRNVMQSQIGSGSCTRNFGYWDKIVDGVPFLKKVPFSKSLRKDVFKNMGVCNEPQTAWTGVMEKEIYGSAISASFKEGVEACVKIVICPNGTVYSNTGCKAGKKQGDFSNVEDLEISVLSGRVHKMELPDSLRSLSKNYCSIQGKAINTGSECKKPIRSSEKFTLFSLSSQWLFTDKEVLIAHGQDVSNICFYDCNEGCSGGCQQCKGDESYESTFGKWSSASCFCKYCPDCSDLYLQIENAKVGVDAVMHAIWDVTIPIEEEEVIECSGCKVSCNGRQLRIERDLKFDIIHICVDENCRIISEKQPDFNYIIPNELLHVTNFKIMFFRSDGKGQATRSVLCLDSHTCQAIHCDVCTERFANPHCYKFVNWVILIMIASGLILVIPAACLIYKIARLIFYILLSPAKLLYKLIAVLVKKCTKNSRAMASSTGSRLSRFVNEDETPVRNVSKSSPSLMVSMVIILILAVCGAFCCENVIAIDNQVLDCLPSVGGEIKCAINTVVEVPLSSIGEESCINVNDQSGSSVHIIKMKTVTIRQKCSKTIQYYTCDADFKLLNTFRCRNAGDCIDDKCEKISSDGPVPVPSVNGDKAGFHGCSRVTGFWGKGCFYASQACQFYKVELQNKLRRSYEVSKCSEWFWEVKMNISVSNKDGVRHNELLLDTTLPVKTLIGSTQLISINTPSVSSTSKCFLRKLSDGMKTAIVDCSNRNAPIVGKIGGIQCATPSLAETASKSCLIDKNAIHLVNQDDNVVFVNRFINTTEEWSRNLLPNILTNSVVSEDKTGQIYIHHTGLSSYNVRVRMEDYKISYTIIKASCEAHFRQLKGCSNCGTGAVLELEVVISNAIRTPVIIKCPSATTSGVELALASKPLTIFRMSFSKSEIDERCSVTCPGNTIDVDIKGTLIGNIKIRQQNETSIFTRGADFFASIPWANFGALRYVYLAIGVISIIPVIYVMYIGFLFLIKVILVKCCKKAVDDVQKRKYVKRQ